MNELKDGDFTPEEREEAIQYILAMRHANELKAQFYAALAKWRSERAKDPR